MDWHWHSWEHYHRHRKHRHKHPILIVSHTAFALEPNKRIWLPMLTNTVGSTLKLAIAFLDQNGSPMASTPAPDAAPAWTNTAALETGAVSTDGLTDVLAGVAAGVDTLGVSLAVGGVTFSASAQVTVGAAPQVLTSIEIVPAP